MRFADQLSLLVPQDTPHRETLIAHAATHLDLIVEANQHMNLTRIIDPREAVIKHILDSIIPWRLFTGVNHVLDAGTGPGFPGLPLALILPETRFTLTESTQKKARFVESVIDALELSNVEVLPDRAEDILRSRRADVITARALAPLNRALGFMGPALKAGSRALLYKGPDVAKEITEAGAEARKYHLQLKVVMRYDLPDALGSRTIVQAG
ncbi:MAG: methyltransferase GidB [Bryobacterales bacterium]|nr:methyltransferase GidB [Bryobacterales bacterium]